MADEKLKWPAEFYESGEAMPDSEDVTARYSSDFDKNNLARIRAIMAQQREIEPVLKYFVDTGYRAMNKVLRGEHLRKRDNDFAREQMVKIDEALASPYNRTPSPLLVYRGITPEFAHGLIDALKADGKFSDAGYIIASTVPRQTPYQLQIELPAGTPYLTLSKFLINEIVLPHGGRLQAVAHHELPQTKVRIVARWLGT
jgi:hypothetical protein